MIEKGSAVIRVILWSASKPPAFNNNNANITSDIPQNTTCHFGDFLAFFVAILFITKIPESADVTKKIMMIAITTKLTIEESGRYSKNLNINAAGLDANSLSLPIATFRSNQTALFPKIVIQKKLNTLGMINTAPTNSRIVLPLEILAINNPTYGDHEIHHAQ